MIEPRDSAPSPGRAMRALLIKGVSGYDVTTRFVDEIGEAFKALGWDVVVIQVLEESELFPLLSSARRRGEFDLVYSVGIFGERRDGAGRTVAEVVGAPHVIQYVDYPLGSWTRLRQTPASTALLVVDPSHVTALRSVYGPERFDHVAFSPHAGLGAPSPPEADGHLFAERRDIPLLFCGSYVAPRATPMWASLPSGLKRLFDDAFDLAMGEDWIPALDALDRVLIAHGFDPDDRGLEQLRENAFAIHDQVRTTRRRDFLQAVIRSRAPIHIRGRGYEPAMIDVPWVDYGGEASIDEAIALMRRSRLVLNLNANFGRGSHERALSAMLAGAAVVSDHSTFFAETFEVGDDMATFNWKQAEDGVAQIHDLLADPERMWRLARSGHLKASAGHRWRDRIPAIIEAARAVSARKA